MAVCVHGTYKKNLESILASGLKRMRRDVNVLIFLDIKKALEETPTIVEGQRSCKRQPNSGSKNCMKDSECREVCIYAEKAMRATCDYTFPRRRCFCHFPCQ
ncbi:unnamed protein product [Brassica rapa subsp. narinosa]